MSDKQVAQRYAKTLFLFAKEQNIIDTVVKDMENISSVFETTPSLQTFLSNPLTSEETLKTFKNSGLSGLISKETMNFINLLERKNRISVLINIPEIFIELYQAHQNLLRVVINSAKKLTENNVGKVTGILQKKFPGKKFLIDNLIEPDLIAGFQIQIGDMIIDSNIKSNLNQIKKKLAA